MARVYKALAAQGSPPHRAGLDAERLARSWFSSAMPEL